MSSNETTRRPIQILLRSKDAIELYTLPDTSSSSTTTSPTQGRVLYRGKSSFHVTSPAGDRVYVHDAAAGLLVRRLHVADDPPSESAFLPDSRSVLMAKCSPRGSYLLTWERTAGGDGDGRGNLKVWDASSGCLRKAVSCKKATLDTMQWTHDEELAFHLVTNEIHLYDAKDWRRLGKVRCSNASSFSLPSVRGYAKNAGPPPVGTATYLFTVFYPETKGKPARVDLLRYPDRMGRESSSVDSSSGPPLASKSLFRAEQATVHWSPRADSALLLTQTAVDSTGESYYGSTNLFLLLETDPKNPSQGAARPVPLPPEASKDSDGLVPIVAASWIPNPTVSGPVPFGVIAGKMPALASLHHGISGEPTFLMGRAHRNVMDVGPHGRFIVCGGYGNLAGGMDFWDRNKGKMIPRRVRVSSQNGRGEEEGAYVTLKEPRDLTITSSSPVVGHQWSPDGRTYLVSTTSPRMNVENGVHVYRYDGTLIDESKLPWDNDKYRPDKLLSAEYVPAPLVDDTINAEGETEFYYYPDRPQSPPPRSLLELKGDDATKALENIRQPRSNGKSPAVVAAYIPPAARAGGGGAYVPPGARRGTHRGTGLAERLRQEREGSAAALAGKKVVQRTGPVGAASVGPVGSDPDAKSKNALRREKQRLAKEKAEKEAAEAERRKKEEEEARAEANKLDPEKRAKKLKKTLKQIDEIKAKADQGIQLNEDQKMKLASEEELRKELASLGL
ncbi:hypothetical protein ACHAW6_013788 [Cyclotella cf. meneghiniana]